MGHLLLEIISSHDSWARASPCSLRHSSYLSWAWPLLSVRASQRSVFCPVLLSHDTFLLIDSPMPHLLQCVQPLTVAWNSLWDNSSRMFSDISYSTCPQFIPFSSLWIMILFLAFLSLWIVPLSSARETRARLESSLSLMPWSIRYWIPQRLFNKWTSSWPLLTCPRPDWASALLSLLPPLVI